MTESEAIEILGNCKNCMSLIGNECYGDGKCFESKGMAISALEEIQQYRATGLTPSMVEKLKDNDARSHRLAVQRSIELDEYWALGTVEELREAMEKQRAKKPIRSDMCTCPSCGTYNETVKKRRNTVNQDIVYCWHCGQAMEIKRSDTKND